MLDQIEGIEVKAYMCGLTTASMMPKLMLVLDCSAFVVQGHSISAPGWESKARVSRTVLDRR
jgi:hypothetical protein